MVDGSRGDTQCLAATSEQKLCILLEMTARWKPTDGFLLMQLCIGLLLLEQQRLERAPCQHVIAYCSGNADSCLEAVMAHLVGRQGQPRGAEVQAMHLSE